MANTDLINRKHCKDFTLRIAQDMRQGWLPKQISQRFLDDLNTKVRNMITSAVMHHPTIGKTVKYLF